MSSTKIYLHLNGNTIKSVDTLENIKPFASGTFTRGEKIIRASWFSADLPQLIKVTQFQFCVRLQCCFRFTFIVP